jgi:hypothetical protein
VGQNLLDVKDVQGKQPIREMLQIAQTRGSGWVDYRGGFACSPGQSERRPSRTRATLMNQPRAITLARAPIRKV